MLHVDLNCLFWKGRTFAQPEKVPFRLTQNIVEGMGATGFEGTYRRACEITVLKSTHGSTRTQTCTTSTRTRTHLHAHAHAHTMHAPHARTIRQ